jgi:hypothetical protein
MSLLPPLLWHGCDCCAGSKHRRLCTLRRPQCFVLLTVSVTQSRAGIVSRPEAGARAGTAMTRLIAMPIPRAYAQLSTLHTTYYILHSTYACTPGRTHAALTGHVAPAACTTRQSSCLRHVGSCDSRLWCLQMVAAWKRRGRPRMLPDNYLPTATWCYRDLCQCARRIKPARSQTCT